MSDAFNAALCRATQLSKPKEEEKTSIKIFGMAGGGGLSHIQNSMNIGGQPHRLAYLKPNKASLLKQLGGSGKSVNGVPAYFWDVGDDPSGAGWDVGKDTDVGTDKDEGGNNISRDDKPKSPGFVETVLQHFIPARMTPRELDEEEARHNIMANRAFGFPSIGRKEGGGLSSIQKQINIGGEPHRLAYINSDEASLLKQLGGSGRNVNGVPAYFWYAGDDTGSGWDVSDPDPGDDSADSQDIDEAAPTSVAAQAEADALAQARTAGLEALGFPMSLEEEKEKEAAAQREKYTAAALREAGPSTPYVVQELFNRPAKTDKDFKEDFAKLERPVGGKWTEAKDVTNWTQAQIDAYLEANPGAVIANTIIDLDGVHQPTTYHDLSDRYGFKGDIQRSHGTGKVSSWQDLKSLASAGMESGATPGKDKDFESYSEASQYVVDQIRKDRQKEQDELDRMNLYRERLGRPARETPVGGWKSPELHESMVFDLANWAIQTGSGISGELLNFLQRQYGSGEFDQEVAGWKDIMDYYNNLGILTGYRGPQFMETYIGEKGSPGEYYDETDPNIQPQTPQEKKKEEEIKKLGLMAKFFEEEDEDEKKKIANELTLFNLTEDEQALIQTAYGETGLPSLMDQIG